jgi:hypothetical protein
MATKRYYHVVFTYKGTTAVNLRATSRAEAIRQAEEECRRNRGFGPVKPLNLEDVELRPDMDEERRQRRKYG